MPKIFISYRRVDSNDIAERIYDNLANSFGEENVFKDQYSIKPGEDFREAIRRVVGTVDVLLVLIGPDWLKVTQSLSNGNVVRRIDHPDDWVRREVEVGLNRLTDADKSNDPHVIPILVRGADMPPRDELPESIRNLAFLQAYRVRSDSDFRRDMAELINHLRMVQPAVPPPPSAVVISQPSVIHRLHLNEPWAIILAAIITGLFVLVAAQMNAQPNLSTALTLTSTMLAAASPTTAASSTLIVPTATNQPTATFTPTPEPSLTPLSPSTTPSPTDAPTPVPPSPLPTVSISVPTVVLPNTTILITAWQNAHCIFTPDDGSLAFGFDTSTGNIQYSVKHKAGTTVSIVCEDVQGRHEENQFVVNSVAIPTATLTSTVTNTPLPPSPTFAPTTTATNTPLPPTLTFTLAPPTQIPTPKPTIDPCIGQVNTSTGASATYYRQRPPSGSATISNKTEVLVVGNSYIQSEKRFYYEIRFDNQSGFITVDRVNVSSTCPYFKS